MAIKRIHTFCKVTCVIQAVFFVVVQTGVVNNWVAPVPFLWLITSILAGIVSAYGMFLLIREKFYARSLRLKSMVVYAFNLGIVIFLQVSYGYHNLDLQNGNDYSTDIVDAPRHRLTADKRMTAKEVSNVWGFLSVPHKTLKSDLDSIILPFSKVDSTLIVRKAINRLGWVIRRHSVTTMSDGGLSDNYEFKAGLTNLLDRLDVVVRLRSNQSGSVVVDIRSSSVRSRRDWGINNLIIKRLGGEILDVAKSYRDNGS